MSDDDKYYVDENGQECGRCAWCRCCTVDDLLGGELVTRCTICDWWVELRIAVPDRVRADWEPA